MARKKGNPLSGKFRNPPQEGNASVPEQVEQDTDQIKLTDQGDAPAELTEAPAGPASAGMLEILANVYDMSPLAANRYRRKHHTDPDLPIRRWPNRRRW